MSLQSVAAASSTKEPENDGAFDDTTLWRLWEIQSICRLLLEATDPESSQRVSQEHLHCALRGMERLIDLTIRRGGKNSALGFNSEE